MFEPFTDIPALTLVLKFLIASSLLLSTIWGLEKLGVFKTPDLAELAWKLAIAGSFLALLPVGDWLSSPIRVEHQRTAALVQEFNEGRPLADLFMPQALPEDKAEKPVPTEQNMARATDSETEITHTGTELPAFTGMLASLRTKDLAGLLWVTLAGLALALLGVAYVGAVKGLGSRTRVAPEDRPNLILRDICAQTGIKHVPYLSRSSDITSPVCLPRKEICLPDWAFDDLPEAELKSLLAHEVGHMVRRDPLMLMVLQALSRLFFFQPLFVLAKKRLNAIAELAADEWAATHTEDARSVAAALYTCATKIQKKQNIQWGLAMADNKSMLRARVERLIGSEAQPFKRAGKGAKAALATGLLTVTLGLPSIQFADALMAHPPEGSEIGDIPDVPDVPEIPEGAFVTDIEMPEPSISISSNEDGKNKSGNVVFSNNNKELKASWDGPFTLNQDETDVAKLEGDTTLTIRSRDGSSKHKIRFENDGGKLSRTYWRNGKKAEFDKTAQTWLASTLQVLVRETGLNAEKRVERMLKQGGVAAVLKEMKQIESDYVFGLYSRHLTNQAELSKKELTQLISLMERLEGDYGKRLALLGLLDQKAMDASMLPKVMKVAEDIESDYELRLLLTPYIDRFGLTEKEAKSLLKIAKSIESDYEMRLLLTAAFDDADISKSNLETLTELATSEIESDYEFRLLLSAFVKQFGKSREATELALEAIGNIDSDYEKRLALGAVTNHGLFNNKSWIMAIEAAITISSDYEKRLALSAIKRRLPDDKKVQKAFSEAVDSISSDYERNRVAVLAPAPEAPRIQAITATTTTEVMPGAPETVTVTVGAPLPPAPAVSSMTMTTTASVPPNVPHSITSVVAAPNAPKARVRTLTATTTANVKPGIPQDMTVTVVAPNQPE